MIIVIRRVISVGSVVNFYPIKKLLLKAASVLDNPYLSEISSEQFTP